MQREFSAIFSQLILLLVWSELSSWYTFSSVHWESAASIAILWNLPLTILLLPILWYLLFLYLPQHSNSCPSLLTPDPVFQLLPQSANS